MRSLINHVITKTGHDRIVSFTTEMIESHLAQLAERGVQRNSRACALNAIRQFARFGIRPSRRWWTADPTLEIDKIRRVKKLPRPFSDADRDALMRAPLLKDDGTPDLELAALRVDWAVSTLEDMQGEDFPRAQEILRRVRGEKR